MRDILFLAHRMPFPPDRGDKIRGFHILKHLAARARVHLVAFADTPADRDPAPEFRRLLASCTVVPRTKSRARALAEALATGRPVSLTAFADPRIAAAVEGHGDMASYVFSGQMAQYVGAPDVMDFVDVDSAKFAAFAESGRGPMRWLMRREARLLAAFEHQVAERAGASVFVSAAEAALFGGPRTVAVENGIDTRHFDPAASFERLHASQGPLVVFTGQMDYRPNVDAVAAFADRTFPAIRRRYPQARFAIVGRAPVPQVHALAQREGVTVTGEVADVRPWLAAAEVCVAPLLLARGIQNKVLEAMAMARPVVASPAAAEGIDHAGCLHVAEPEDAEAVCALLADPADAHAIGHRARAQVIRRYAWNARLAPLDALLGPEQAKAA
jgi:sugar transferase (PEP-CTERM/EpsH1 system associated)